MKGIKKIWLPAAFGLLSGSLFCLPVEARPVTISTDVVNNVVGIGTLTSSNYDQLNFSTNSSTPDLIPDLVPNPNVTQTITLGTALYSMNQDTCTTIACSGPVSTNDINPNSTLAPLTFTIVSEGVKQNVSLGFTWSTVYTPFDGINPLNRVSGTLVFSDFNSTFIFHNGFDSLIITLIKPQEITYENFNPNIPLQIPIQALVQLIPEPSSLPLFGIGLVAFALVRRRNFKLLV
jgi:hypothetical protein